VTAKGAYGLALTGLPDARDLLVDAPASWPRWRIERVVGPGDGTDHLDGDSASAPLEPAGRLDVRRADASATLTLPEPPDDGAVAHPYLAPVAALAAYWGGRLSLHAGAYVGAEGVWGVLGDRAAGKSSVLASLAAAGAPVLADDLLVVADGAVLAGPRCVDLRADAARALGLGESIGVTGGRERWRVLLGPVAAQAPLAGFVDLTWGDEARVADVPASDRLPLLLRSFALRAGRPDPSALLDLAALPMLRLERPRRWEAHDAAVEALIAAAGGRGAVATGAS
jgi:hypothetical protein